MTMEQLQKIVEMLGLTDLGDAALYLDEEGHLEAFLSLAQPEPQITQNSSEICIV